MSQALSPLSPSIANRVPPATVETKTYSIHEDRENACPSPVDLPSSPFVGDVVSSPVKDRSPTKTPTLGRGHLKKYTPTPLTEDALRTNEGLTGTIEVIERGEYVQEYDQGNDAIPVVAGPAGYAGMDDTCISTFSAAPTLDMTLFAQMRPTPTKAGLGSPTKTARQAQHLDDGFTPRQVGRMTPGSSRRQPYDEASPSPTPRRSRPSPGGDTTNLILDFTEQFNAFEQSSSRSPSRNSRQSPRRQPDLASYVSGRRTPSPTKHGLPPSTPSESRHLANLLDFDLPPAPTPRSIPSITARELESLKSTFLSQVSSLRATLSGKEAEVSSLKEAVGDAERRVGEALEEIREQRGMRESLEADKLDWERRDKEMQSVLRNVKEEIIRSDREREQLQQKMEESEKKREDAEAKAVETESRMAGLRVNSDSGATNTDGVSDAGSTDSAVEAAVTKVAKELHGLYRHKHEGKVKALKKSYEARWEKKIRELESKVSEVSKENEDLRLSKDATMSGVIPGTLIASASRSSEQQLQQDLRNEEQRAAEAQRAQEQAAQIAGLVKEVTSVKRDNGHLMAELEASHLEMADLVAATEEMMSLSMQPAPFPSSSSTTHRQPTNTTPGVENLRGSISRSMSGLKAPGESRIGRMNSAPSVPGGVDGKGRSGSALGMARSGGMMSNIERMGRGRGGE